MNGNYHLNRFYAQERIDARLQEAKRHRLVRHNRQDNVLGFVSSATTRANSWVGRAASRAAHSLEALGQARLAPFGR